MLPVGKSNLNLFHSVTISISVNLCWCISFVAIVTLSEGSSGFPSWPPAKLLLRDVLPGCDVSAILILSIKCPRVRCRWNKWSLSWSGSGSGSGAIWCKNLLITSGVSSSRLPVSNGKVSQHGGFSSATAAGWLLWSPDQRVLKWVFKAVAGVPRRRWWPGPLMAITFKCCCGCCLW